MKIPEKERPTCSCGERMQLDEYTGYYDSFKYWQCNACDLDGRAQDAEPDYQWSGIYA